MSDKEAQPGPVLTSKRRNQEKQRSGWSRRIVDGNEYAATTDANTSPLWKRFQRDQTHSLRINVSDIAACTGFHPFKDLVKLFLMDHVYQGYGGQALLEHDAHLLGISLESEEEHLHQLAQLAGRETEKALKEVLLAKKDAGKVKTIEKAEKIKDKVLQEARKSKKLSKEQLEVLKDGSRHSVYTGFGTKWESDALDLYEKQCGWEVNERNSKLQIWPFERSGGDTVQPMAPSYAVDLENLHCPPTRAKPEVIDLVGDDDGNGVEHATKKRKAYCDTAGAENVKLFNSNDGDEGSAMNGDKNSVEKQVCQQTSVPTRKVTGKSDSSCSQHSSPFFSLRGCVDGIREELVPCITGKSSSEVDDDDSWILNRVVIECKHRMKQLRPSPPLYEMIQATAYCLMYEVQDADLVQVLRTQIERQNLLPKKKSADKEGNHPREKESEAKHADDGGKQKVADFFRKRKAQCSTDSPTKRVDTQDMAQDGTIGTKPVRERRAENDTVANADPIVPSSLTQGASQNNIDESESSERAKELISIKNPNDCESCEMDTESFSTQIGVDRISINDPCFRHGHNWRTVILPRLRSWVEAVYRFRQDDCKRYGMLLALASSSSSKISPKTWNILLNECPWLNDCDTLYHRQTY